MPQRSTTPDPRISWPAGHDPASAVIFAQNTIDVAAPPEAVWSLLVDCVAWPSWYARCSDVSVLRGASPMASADAAFRFKTLGFFFEPEVRTFEPHRMLVWAAKGPAGTSGSHAWLIEPTPGGCRVATEETQKGALLYLLRAKASRDLHAAHDEWLRSLKGLAESARVP